MPSKPRSEDGVALSPLIANGRNAVPRRRRIFLIDDHPAILQGYAVFLRQFPEWEVVGSAADHESALPDIIRLGVDLVVSDLSFPDGIAIDSLKALRRDAPDVRILIMTMHDDLEIFFRALHAGVNGYCLKTDPLSDLRESITGVLAGGTFFSAEIREKWERAKRQKTDRDQDLIKLGRLNSSELEVLKGIARGHRNKEIAPTLPCKPRTVEKYREKLMEKLEIHTIAELTLFAVRVGLITIPGFSYDG